MGWDGLGWDLCAGLFYEHRFAMLIIAWQWGIQFFVVEFSNCDKFTNCGKKLSSAHTCCILA